MPARPNDVDMAFILCKHCQQIVKDGEQFDCKQNICPLEQFEIVDEITIEQLTGNNVQGSTEGGPAPSDSPIRIKMYEQ